MKSRRIMTRRLFLSLAVAMAVTGILVAHRGEPASNPDGPGVVYVYFPSLCATPGDPADCHELPRPDRPSFQSMEACSAHANAELRRENNPKLMASCMRRQEG